MAQTMCSAPCAIARALRRPAANRATSSRRAAATRAASASDLRQDGEVSSDASRFAMSSVAPEKAEEASSPKMKPRAEKLGDPPVNVAVRTSGGEMIDCFTALERNRIIFIGDRIDEDVATSVCAKLLALQYDAPDKDITIFLNCTAGTQYCVTTILDMMDYVSNDISVVAMGCVAGPPAMLLAGATKGKRLALPSARIILSQPLGGLSGTSYEVKIQAKELSRNARSQVAFFAKFTGKSFEDMGEYLVRDTYMSPKEAMEINLIDGEIGVDAKIGGIATGA
jgi:ATP-dependent Clp protease protease subunit